MINIPPGMSAEDILKLMQQNNMTRDTQNRITVPASTGGGGPISSSLNMSGGGMSPMAPKGPTSYMPQSTPMSAPGGDFNMTDYLNNKLGPSTPQIRSITSNGGGNGPVVTGIGGGGDNSLQSILSALTGGFDKANAANESRYNEAKNTLAGYGKSYQNEINQNYNQDVAHQEQDAISRGLGNSSIRNALVGGARRRQQDATLNLQDRLAAQRVGLLQSKYDNGPDPMQMAQLIAQASQGAYGSGNTMSSIASSLGLTR